MFVVPFLFVCHGLSLTRSGTTGLAAGAATFLVVLLRCCFGLACFPVNLSTIERCVLADAMIDQTFGAGEIIFRQGDAGETFYLVKRGTVVCTQRQRGSEEPVEVAKLDRGACFGEVRSLLVGPRKSVELTASRTMAVAGCCWLLLAVAGCCYCFDTPSTDSDAVVRRTHIVSLQFVCLHRQIALMTDRPRQATVTALGEVVCLVLDRRLFKRVMGPMVSVLKRNSAVYNSFVQAIM